MPPPSSPESPQKMMDTGHQLPEHNTKSSSFGPTVGIIIILVLLLFGALYFWGASMNREQQPPPFIPEENSTTPAGQQ